MLVVGVEFAEFESCAMSNICGWCSGVFTTLHRAAAAEVSTCGLVDILRVDNIDLWDNSSDLSKEISERNTTIDADEIKPFH
ncbi:hypothetical protein C2G38_2189434 [Gigaspora rosea]|uniref:Uncharacterized protein n=1 Tax=Gigaspora rosea TaxID=44941 RepID=A0A397V2E7_9GLOM|nr:hypothetical protein C2G38_2189434 [Gigaspora rosea]